MTGRSPKAKDPASILAISVMLLIVGVAGITTMRPWSVVVGAAALGLWWAKEQRALVVTAPHAIPEHRQVLVARGPGETGWASTLATIGLDNPASRALAAYLATLPPAVPKPGETWEIGTGADTHTAIVVEAPDGSACFVWHPHGDIAIRHVSRFEGCRRKIADAPSGADQ